MAKSGQYIPQRSHPLHLSGFTACGGWYPFELKADDSDRTLAGQNSTQKPQALHRSTTIETDPRAMKPPHHCAILSFVGVNLDVMQITANGDFTQFAKKRKGQSRDKKVERSSLPTPQARHGPEKIEIQPERSFAGTRRPKLTAGAAAEFQSRKSRLRVPPA
jgi:hypothetical protein